MAAPVHAQQYTKRPLIVVCAFPVQGHMEGALQITAHLTAKGFQVFCLCGEQFERQTRAAGAEPWGNALPIDREHIKRQYDVPPGPMRFNYQQKHIFIDGAAARHEILKKCLESIRERFPDQQVIIFSEAAFLGAVPYMLGAPLPRGYDRIPRVIQFNTTINIVDSVDVAPFMLCLPPARNDEDRARYRAHYDEVRPAGRETVAYANRVFKSLGATEELKGDMFFSDVICLSDVTLMACSPSLEYPRTDLPPTLKYIGGLPLKTLSADLVVPEWWEEVRANSVLPRDAPEHKRLVFVSQGTANNEDYGQLLIPTMKALYDYQDIIVIATLGKREGKLPEEISVPDNARVIDYYPYDAILPLADVFVCNGGYGGFMHGVMNGTPMVLAGTAGDKGEVAARAEWAGLAVNLRTNTPTEAMIRDAVDEILADGKFKENALRLKAENEAMNALEAIERQIWEFAE
jgi:UDP:flavonoid glycosyltransferase YjiC (YdhE family)